jgi:hypothetical protein
MPVRVLDVRWADEGVAGSDVATEVDSGVAAEVVEVGATAVPNEASAEISAVVPNGVGAEVGAVIPSGATAQIRAVVPNGATAEVRAVVPKEVTT